MTATTGTTRKLLELIKDTRFGMLTHRHANGMLHAHPLTTQNRSIDEQSLLYFFIPRNGELYGRLLTDGPFDSLRASVLAERRLHIDFAGAAPQFEMPGVTVRARTERSLELAFDPAKIPTPKLIAAITAGHAVDDIHVEEPAIEEVIARFYDLHDAGEA